MHIARDADPALLPHAAAGGVRFVFDGPATLDSVALAGTFNSWVGDACKLARVTPTRWTCTLPLPPGRHLYKFVLDDMHWIADPANPWMSEDGQGNSCVTVCLDGTVFLRRRGLCEDAPGVLYRNHKALASPAWLRDAVVYQLSVRAFGGGFDGVRARLGHLADLGVNTIWMMPIHPIGAAGRRGTLGDPYAVRDFETIDPALGDEDGLRRLVDAIHARGMRIVFDWTLNRSSADHPLTVTHPEWFQRDREGNVMYAVPRREYFAGFDFSNAALRRSVGARVIQLPSGSMPTISECACWLIWRTRVRRYAYGIQSFGSMRSSASMRAWKRVAASLVSSSAVGVLSAWLYISRIWRAAGPRERAVRDLLRSGSPHAFAGVRRRTFA